MRRKISHLYWSLNFTNLFMKRRAILKPKAKKACGASSAASDVASAQPPAPYSAFGTVLQAPLPRTSATFGPNVLCSTWVYFLTVWVCTHSTLQMCMTHSYTTLGHFLFSFRIPKRTWRWCSPTYQAWNDGCLMEEHGGRACGCFRGSTRWDHTQRQKKHPYVSNCFCVLLGSSSSAETSQDFIVFILERSYSSS